MARVGTNKQCTQGGTEQRAPAQGHLVWRQQNGRMLTEGGEGAFLQSGPPSASPRAEDPDASGSRAKD